MHLQHLRTYRPDKCWEKPSDTGPTFTHIRTRAMFTGKLSSHGVREPKSHHLGGFTHSKAQALLGKVELNALISREVALAAAVSLLLLSLD